MKGTPRFPGIFRRAKTLGVTHGHLFHVLTGERKSPKLLARYAALIAAEQAAAGGMASGTTLPAGTVFTAGSREVHEQLIAEHPGALRHLGEALEALRAVTITTVPVTPHPSPEPPSPQLSSAVAQE